jgi:hypothetical protein
LLDGGLPNQYCIGGMVRANSRLRAPDLTKIKPDSGFCAAYAAVLSNVVLALDRQLLETATKTCRSAAHAIFVSGRHVSPPSRETGTDTNAGVTCRIPGLWTFICCNTRDTLEWCSLLSPVEVVRAPSPRSLVHTPASGRIPSHIGRTHRRASHPRCLPEDDRQPAPSRPVEPHLKSCCAIALTSGLPVRRLGANAARACRLGVNNRSRGISTVCSREHGDCRAGSIPQEEEKTWRGESGRRGTEHQLDRWTQEATVTPTSTQHATGAKPIAPIQPIRATTRNLPATRAESTSRLRWLLLPPHREGWQRGIRRLGAS